MRDIWLKIQDWICSWSNGVYIGVLCGLIVLALLCVMSFVKKSYSTKKDTKFNWGFIVLFILLAALVVIVAIAGKARN